MFTGLVEGVGRIRQVLRRGRDRVLVVESLFDIQPCRIGDSVSVSGVCLTVTQEQDRVLHMDVSHESLSRSTLGELKPGERVNLERALRLSDRLGGHLVSGHVDGVGRIVKKEPRAESWLVGVEMEKELSRYTVEKGSIAIDGISLTINHCRDGYVEVNIIPQTGKETTLLQKERGQGVNIETDLIGKYIEKLLPEKGPGEAGKKTPSITLEGLRERGFLG
ncbi:MAG: riboflavin synthase [Desulfobacteraceae bacterium]|jgi:riboflavin synthase